MWELPPLRDLDVVDVDVLYGYWMARGLRCEVDDVLKHLANAGIRKGLILSNRGGAFDAGSGNEETFDGSSLRPGYEPVGTVDLRNALDAEHELSRLKEWGARALRLFPAEQDIDPRFPAFTHVVDMATELGMWILTSGDVRLFGPVAAGRGARVTFLDVHAYHVGDFVLLAREDPGLTASTRLLNAPDSIERVVQEVGATRLMYGSRTPTQELEPSLLRLLQADVSHTDRTAIASGNARTALAASQERS